MKLRSYICYILRRDNSHDIRVFHTAGPSIKTFTHRGERYAFDKRCSFIIKEPTTIRYWLTPKRFMKYDRLLVYRESDVETMDAIAPLRAPTATNRIEESPAILRGVTRSQLLKTYRRKQKFGSGVPTWQVFAVIGVVAVAILLILTGQISIEG